MENLVDLYLSITDMEYFPMECKMIGQHNKNSMGSFLSQNMGYMLFTAMG